MYSLEVLRQIFFVRRRLPRVHDECDQTPQMLHFCARVDLRRVDGVIPFGIFIHGAQYPEAQLSRRWQDTGSKTSSGWLITLVDIVRSLLWLAVETHGILPVGRAAMVLLDAV